MKVVYCIQIRIICLRIPLILVLENKQERLIHRVSEEYLLMPYRNVTACQFHFTCRKLETLHPCALRAEGFLEITPEVYGIYKYIRTFHYFFLNLTFMDPCTVV